MSHKINDGLTKDQRWYYRNRDKKLAYVSKRYRLMAEERKRYARDWWRKRRIELLTLYGGVCVCCMENRWEFLSIDHVNGSGGKHRDSMPRAEYIKWLSKKRQKGFQILCHNCNNALGHYGYCPHDSVG